MRHTRVLAIAAGLVLAAAFLNGCGGNGGSEPFAGDNYTLVLQDKEGPLVLTAKGTFNEEGGLIADAVDQNQEVHYFIIASEMKLEPTKFFIQVHPKVINMGWESFFLEPPFKRTSKGLEFEDTVSTDRNAQTWHEFSISATPW